MKQNDQDYRFDRIRNTVNENLGIEPFEYDTYDLPQHEIDRLNACLKELNGDDLAERAYLETKARQSELYQDRQFEETMRLLSGKPVKVIYNRSAEDILDLKQECLAVEIGEEARQSGAFYWGFNKIEMINGNLVVRSEDPKWQTVYPEMKIVR